MCQIEVVALLFYIYIIVNNIGFENLDWETVFLLFLIINSCLLLVISHSAFTWVFWGFILFVVCWVFLSAFRNMFCFWLVQLLDICIVIDHY